MFFLCILLRTTIAAYGRESRSRDERGAIKVDDHESHGRTVKDHVSEFCVIVPDILSTDCLQGRFRMLRKAGLMLFVQWSRQWPPDLAHKTSM